MIENLIFISQTLINEAIKYLVSGKDGDHLPVSDESGKPNHRLMGAAWAALHGGYRGNKYQGGDKSAAISKLSAMYKSEGMETPDESFALDGAFLIESHDEIAEALRDSDSHAGSAMADAAAMHSKANALHAKADSGYMKAMSKASDLKQKVEKAINDKVKAGVDMDGDNDGEQDAGDAYRYGDPAYVMATFPHPTDPSKGKAVYSMSGKMFQVSHHCDSDGDCHVGSPSEVENSYTPVANSASKESFSESYASFDVAAESAYNASKGELTVTVIRPGVSKNGRYYSPELLKKSASILEGAKMFADHATDREMKDRPEGSVNNWVAQLKDVKAESDGTIKGTAVIIDPNFKSKIERLNESKLLPQMGVSIRVAGKYSATPGPNNSKAVESFDACRSVDFVTFAGAGGQAEILQ